MNLPANELVALLVAISFAAGPNVYATLATLGLLGRAGLLSLPSMLHFLSNGWIIAASGMMFVTEFFAEKIPAFDLIWNALNTFVRVPLAALLAYVATSRLFPEKQLLARALGGAIALGAHGGKTAVRAAVTPSPEPFSNITLSLGKDAVAIGLTVVRHPASLLGCRYRRRLLGNNDRAGVPGGACPTCSLSRRRATLVG